MFKTLERLLAITTVFLIPTQLALHFWPAYSLVFGIRVDYLSPAIYLTDLLVIGLLTLWFINERKSFVSLFRNKSFIFIILSLAILNTVFSTSFWVTAFRWIKLAEFAFLGFYFFYRKNFVGGKKLYLSLFFSAVVFSAIGIGQFFLERTTGLLYLLGERTFNITTPGIALAFINGAKYLRAYSTFPHPNALAGFLGAVIIMLTGIDEIKRTWWILSGLLIISLGFVFSFSLSAFLALIFISVIFIGKRGSKTISILVKTFFAVSVIASLLLPILSNKEFSNTLFSKNIKERLDLSIISGKMVSDRFWAGEGLNTFIINIPRFNTGIQMSWLLQPVHNIYLLVFAETGIIGLLLFCWGIYSLIKHLLKTGATTFLAVILFILFTGLTDHYWLTIQQNLLFLSFFIGTSFSVKMIK